MFIEATIKVKAKRDCQCESENSVEPSFSIVHRNHDQAIERLLQCFLGRFFEPICIRR